MGDIVAKQEQFLELLIESTRRGEILWGCIRDAYYHRMVRPHMLEVELRVFTRDAEDRKSGDMVVETYENLHYIQSCSQIVVLIELIKRQKSEFALDRAIEAIGIKR